MIWIKKKPYWKHIFLKFVTKENLSYTEGLETDLIFKDQFHFNPNYHKISKCKLNFLLCIDVKILCNNIHYNSQWWNINSKTFIKKIKIRQQLIERKQRWKYTVIVYNSENNCFWSIITLIVILKRKIKLTAMSWKIMRNKITGNGNLFTWSNENSQGYV